MSIKRETRILITEVWQNMEEKVYKVMGGAGAMNIVLGVVMLVVGVTTGVLLIIGGSKLVNKRTMLTF